MSIIKCPECGAKVSNKAKQCPKCACPILIDNEQTIELTSKKLKKQQIICWLLVIIGILITIIGPMSSNGSNETAIGIFAIIGSFMFIGGLVRAIIIRFKIRRHHK